MAPPRIQVQKVTSSEESCSRLVLNMESNLVAPLCEYSRQPFPYPPLLDGDFGAVSSLSPHLGPQHNLNLEQHQVCLNARLAFLFEEPRPDNGAYKLIKSPNFLQDKRKAAELGTNQPCTLCNHRIDGVVVKRRYVPGSEKPVCDKYDHDLFFKKIYKIV